SSGMRRENQPADRMLRCRAHNRTQQREAAPLAIDVVLRGGKRAIPPPPPAAPLLPDRETNQLEPFEGALREVQLCVSELSRRVAPVVRRNLDRHGDCSLSAIPIAYLWRPTGGRGFKENAGGVEQDARPHPSGGLVVSGASLFAGEIRPSGEVRGDNCGCQSPRRITCARASAS